MHNCKNSVLRQNPVYDNRLVSLYEYVPSPVKLRASNLTAVGLTISGHRHICRLPKEVQLYIDRSKEACRAAIYRVEQANRDGRPPEYEDLIRTKEWSNTSGELGDMARKALGKR